MIERGGVRETGRKILDYNLTAVRNGFGQLESEERRCRVGICEARRDWKLWPAVIALRRR